MTERLLRESKYELPGAGVERLTVDADFVADPAGTLGRLLLAGADQRERGEWDAARQFAAQFRRAHGVTLRIPDETAHRLAERAASEGVDVRALCERLFKDYQFGLKLIQQNTRQTQFDLPPAAVDDPDKYISELVLESYRPGSAAAAAENPAG